jgi:hypothetical protein
MNESLIDCDAGRRLGCNTFCCRLVVRYAEDERPPSPDGTTAKGCVDKAPDGLCVHIDRITHRCGIWDKRPRICREYDCNTDYLLQIAVRVGVTNIVQLSRDALATKIAEAHWVTIPGCPANKNAEDA